MRTVVAAAVACLSLAGLSVAADVQASIKKDVSIPAGGLGPALQTLSQERHVHIVFISEDVDRLSTQGASGSLTVDEALNQLLSGTGLTYQYIDAETVSILPAAVAPGASEAAEIPPGKAKGARKSFLTRFRIAQASSASQGDGSGDAASPRQTGQDSFAEQTIDEIVVTAQKREERLQDVPISITVLTGAQLDQSPIQGVTEALSRVPGTAVNVTYQGGGTQVAVRGVTAGGALFNGSSPISYYLDSVPFGMVRQAIGPDVNAYDLKRVEVLRGPQGTLYGASAQNGVVRVLTEDADPDEFKIKARTSGSSTKDGDESYRGDMAINVPVIEGRFAVRAVGGYQDLGGWIDRPGESDSNDAEIRNMRIKAQATPTDKLSIGLSAWASRADYGAPSIADDSGRSTSVHEEDIATDFDAFGLKIGYDFPLFALTAQTGYLEYMNDSFLELAGGLNVAQTSLDSEVFSEEIILNSTSDGAWRWIIGGMYRDAEDRQFQEITRDGIRVTANVLDQTYISESFALFGELTRKFFDGRLELTGGMRYFEDEVVGREDSRLTGATPDQLVRTKDKFDEVSPRVVLTWHISDNATLYGSYAEGFRSGFGQSGSLRSVAPQFPPLEADTLNNYELGSKGSFAGGFFEYEAAVYFIDWQNVQQSLTVPIPGGVGLATALVNGESASGVGVDLGLTVRPVEGMQLGVSGSWNDLTMDSDVFSFVTPTTPVLLFAEGDRLNVSPEYTFGGFADYSFEFGSSGFMGALSLSANYTSEMDLRTIVLGQQRIGDGDSILLGRADFSVTSPKGWVMTLFVDNIDNEQAIPIRVPFAGNTDNYAQVRPRTVGLQLEYAFR